MSMMDFESLTILLSGLRQTLKLSSVIVVNLSNENFSPDEMSLLNRGLNFSVKPLSLPLIDVIADVETAIQYKPFDVKKQIREKASQVIIETKSFNAMNKPDLDTIKWNRALKSLKNRNVFYMKSDKSNKVVVINKDDYNERMIQSITEDNFKVNKMVKDSKSIIDILHKVFDVNKYRLRESNPQVPLMYGLPKIHKTGDKMRKIVSCVNSPFEKPAKWLMSEMKKFGRFEGFSVENFFEFIEKVKDIELTEDEILISFDVTALFPSVPVNVALDAIKEHLQKSNVSIEHTNAYIFAIETCMKYNCFQFRNTYYSNDFGCSMGNSLSPYIAEAFMCKLEREMKDEEIFPRIWWRYVDDTFAVVKKSDVERVLNLINSRHSSIKFTYELENALDHTLSFLDLKIKRFGSKIQFDVYRKPTTTDRYITHDSIDLLYMDCQFLLVSIQNF
ncbi:uncharacterized protein LOC129912768 [Episyrphus balteatus]|uniref:uncharacterized protein LOC129912768 n=1 Tax=Episyrphus balteatus TaxID=286459 RepID=UPI002485D3DB|nr:uncharacterized protein LOC129912768 [Episyrphus balteatus]